MSTSSKRPPGMMLVRRADVRVEIEARRSSTLTTAVAAADRRLERALEREPACARSTRASRRESAIAAARHRRHAGDLAVPRDVGARRLEDADGRVGDLGADPVARDQRDCQWPWVRSGASALRQDEQVREVLGEAREQRGGELALDVAVDVAHPRRLETARIDDRGAQHRPPAAAGELLEADLDRQRARTRARSFTARIERSCAGERIGEVRRSPSSGRGSASTRRPAGRGPPCSPAFRLYSAGSFVGHDPGLREAALGEREGELGVEAREVLLACPGSASAQPSESNCSTYCVGRTHELRRGPRCEAG